MVSLFVFFRVVIQNSRKDSPWKKHVVFIVQSQCRQFLCMCKSTGNSQFPRTTSKWLRTHNPTGPATVPWRWVSTEGQRWRGGRRSRRPENSPGRCRSLHTHRHTVSPWTPQTSGDWREVVREKWGYSLQMKYCFSEGKICS